MSNNDSDAPKGFFQAVSCKKCGRYRRVNMRPRLFTVDPPDPKWYTVVVRDGVTFTANAICGACEQAVSVRVAEMRLLRARERLDKLVAQANAMHEKYKPK